MLDTLKSISMCLLCNPFDKILWHMRLFLQWSPITKEESNGVTKNYGRTLKKLVGNIGSSNNNNRNVNKGYVLLRLLQHTLKAKGVREQEFWRIKYHKYSSEDLACVQLHTYPFMELTLSRTHLFNIASYREKVQAFVKSFELAAAAVHCAIYLTLHVWTYKGRMEIKNFLFNQLTHIY